MSEGIIFWNYKVRQKTTVVIILLAFGLLMSMVIACAFGAVQISFIDVTKMLLHRLTPIQIVQTWRPVDETIIFNIRLPRVAGGALVGSALATAGVLFQGLLRNPMADPYIIGTSAGAGLGATLAMIMPFSIYFLGFGSVPVAAFAGSLITVIIVYRLAKINGKTPIVSILLAGFVVSSLLSAIVFFLLSIGNRFGLNIHSVYSFLMGHISVTSWNQLIVIAPLTLGGIILARLYAMHLNAFSLGEEGAAYLGIDVEKEKIQIMALGSLLTATAVSISGLIGFVGLVIPHTIRLILGPDHKTLIPAAAMAGALFLVIADLLARTILAPVELPVGVITAIIGGPFFLSILRKSKREYAF